MKNQSIVRNEQEMRCEEYREKLKQIFDDMADVRALKFFYKFVSGLTADTPCIFGKGEE